MSETLVLGECLTDRSFDHYARLVRRLLAVPVALVSIVEHDRQVFPGLAGVLPELWMGARATPLSHSFCQHVVSNESPLVVGDARSDPRLSSSLAIRDLDVVAYAGWPVADDRGVTVGSLCAIDSCPRAWTEDELSLLRDLAQACSAEIASVSRQAREGEAPARTIFSSVDMAMAFHDNEKRLVLGNSLAERAASACGFDSSRSRTPDLTCTGPTPPTRCPTRSRSSRVRSAGTPSPTRWSGSVSPASSGRSSAPDSRCCTPTARTGGPWLPSTT